VEADFAIPGLSGRDRARALPVTVLTLGDEALLTDAWRAAERDAVRISEEGLRGDGPGRTIDAHPEVGYRLFARYFGTCLVAPDGARMLCVPPPVESWRWQRFLVGRCLPLAALLRGYEVLHAGAVEIGGRVVAVLGPRGAGKTSLTLQLVLQGASFFTDDVLALDERLQAHPGFGVLNVRAAEHVRMQANERAALGALLGQTGRDKRHYAMRPAEGARELRAMYFLTPGSGSEAATIAPFDAPEPLRLLTSAFIHETRRPEHLGQLLDVCAKLSETVPMFEVTLEARENAKTLAGRLRAHVERETGA
jgi:hypothetical protein